MCQEEISRGLLKHDLLAGIHRTNYWSLNGSRELGIQRLKLEDDKIQYKADRQRGKSQAHDLNPIELSDMAL